MRNEKRNDSDPNGTLSDDILEGGQGDYRLDSGAGNDNALVFAGDGDVLTCRRMREGFRESRRWRGGARRGRQESALAERRSMWSAKGG